MVGTWKQPPQRTIFWTLWEEERQRRNTALSNWVWAVNKLHGSGVQMFRTMELEKIIEAEGTKQDKIAWINTMGAIRASIDYTLPLEGTVGDNKLGDKR